MEENGQIVYGIDIGGTEIKVVALNSDGTEIYRQSIPTEYDQQSLIRCIEKIVSADDKSATKRRESVDSPLIGIASPGLAAKDNRSIVWMQGRMETVQGLDWTESLSSKRLIPVVNDAHAALLGEVWQGVVKGALDVVMLTLGTGVGGAAIVDGNLLRGHLGRAGHLGHISLDTRGELDIVNTPGSLEDAVGNCTILARSEGRFSDTQTLVEAANNGDVFAQELWGETIITLAAGITSFINLFDPEIVILGGGMIAAGERLFHLLQAEMNRVEWRPTGTQVKIVPAKLGSYAGAYGAAYQAFKINSLI